MYVHLKSALAHIDGEVAAVEGRDRRGSCPVTFVTFHTMATPCGVCYCTKVLKGRIHSNSVPSNECHSG